MNVNGTSPATEWLHVNTLANDMDESTVPDTPYGLKGKTRILTLIDLLFINSSTRLFYFSDTRTK